MIGHFAILTATVLLLSNAEALTMIGLIILGVALFWGWRVYARTKQRTGHVAMPMNTKELLQAHVAFYRQLNADQQLVFENRIKDFLQRVAITGIGTTVGNLDRILIASGAIMVIFSFPDWRYNNISEVLLYRDAFSEDYQLQGNDRNILGMVGDGAMKGQMILSQPSVRASFQHPHDGHNTVIHEFVHLLDKADGATDGIPDYLLQRPFLLPWIQHMHQTIQEMKQNQSRDIDFYGATNDAEFLAVVSEYFFERPDELKSKHRELYQLLEQMFHPSSQIQHP